MKIRLEKRSDLPSIYRLNVAAFETSAEANLVDALRANAHPILSLVAEVETEIVGHLFLSPVTLDGHPELKAMGLAPMAVSPAHQRKGIGSALVRAGIDTCTETGIEAIVVLGHPTFYPRFGFEAASNYAIDSIYPVPKEVFMIMPLRPGALAGKSGRIHYHKAFDAL